MCFYTNLNFLFIGGYYSQVISPGLRIISLNTILWYIPNDFTEKMGDPANQFKWLEEVLINCSKLSEKVFYMIYVFFPVMLMKSFC